MSAAKPGGSGILVAMVLVALVMIPVAVLSRRLDTIGRRKPLFLMGYAVLPVHIFLSSLTTDA